MNWFNGRLEIDYLNGDCEIVHNLQFKDAAALVESKKALIKTAIYYPSPINMM